MRGTQKLVLMHGVQT